MRSTHRRQLSVRVTLLLLGALALSPNARAAVGLSISPAKLTNDFTGKVALTITGVSPGQTVRVERFSDLNSNGAVDGATDRVFRSFTVTDGQLPIIGGVRNLNVPGDDDGAVNGQIRVDLDVPGIDNVFGTASGGFLYRVSDPANGFASVTQPFTVAQKKYAQGIRGRVTAAAGGAPLAGAVVVLLNATGIGIGGAFADATGHFEIQTPPGDYLIVPFFDGYVADVSAGSASVITGQFTTNNLALPAGAFTISGRLTDVTSGAGLAGVFMLGESTNNLFAGGMTDADGNYSYAVSASQWKVQVNSSALPQLGCLRPDRLKINITSASVANVNFAAPRATALIYGTVKDNLGNPVNAIQTRGDDQDHNLYETDGISFGPNGNYTLGVLAGNWYATVQSDTLPAGYTAGAGVSLAITAGQALEANLVLSSTTAHLVGKVVNGSGIPQAGVEIQAGPQNGGNGPQAVTAGDGSFDLGVAAGAWTIQLQSSDNTPSNLIGPSLSFDVTDGVNISGISYVVQFVTAQITGSITNAQGGAVGNVNVFASATIESTSYNQYAKTDGSGHFSLGVLNGTWQVGVSCEGGGSLSSLGYQCVNNQSVTINGANGVANFVALSGPTPVSLEVPAYVAGSQFQFTLHGAPGAKYRIEASTDLSDLSSWTNLGTNTANGGLFFFPDTAAPGFGQRFYRAVQVP